MNPMSSSRLPAIPPSSTLGSSKSDTDKAPKLPMELFETIARFAIQDAYALSRKNRKRPYVIPMKLDGAGQSIVDDTLYYLDVSDCFSRAGGGRPVIADTLYCFDTVASLCRVSSAFPALISQEVQRHKPLGALMALHAESFFEELALNAQARSFGVGYNLSNERVVNLALKYCPNLDLKKLYRDHLRDQPFVMDNVSKRTALNKSLNLSLDLRGNHQGDKPENLSFIGYFHNARHIRLHGLNHLGDGSALLGDKPFPLLETLTIDGSRLNAGHLLHLKGLAKLSPNLRSIHQGDNKTGDKHSRLDKTDVSAVFGGIEVFTWTRHYANGPYSENFTNWYGTTCNGAGRTCQVIVGPTKSTEWTTTMAVFYSKFRP